MENDSDFTEEQQKEVRRRLVNAQEERQARHELLSENRKSLQLQFVRIRQPLDQVLDLDSLIQRARYHHYSCIDSYRDDYLNNHDSAYRSRRRKW